MSFLPIQDVIGSDNLKVNLIGVVTETGLPRKSRGTDCFVPVRIVDESRSSPGLTVNFFMETMDMLPQVMRGGDIIQLSQVVIKTHGTDVVYAVFSKKYSSFALYEGKNSTSFTPYQCSVGFCPRERDKKFILDLRKWLAGLGQQIDAGSTDLLQLKELKEGVYFNLICKVLHVCEIEKDQWMLFVWDGTDTPPIAIKTDLQDEKENSLPLQLESIPLSRDVLCTFPPVGTVLRVNVDSDNGMLGLNYIKKDQWVKLIGLRCEVRSALWYAVLMPFTKLCYLSDDDDRALQLKRRLLCQYATSTLHAMLILCVILHHLYNRSYDDRFSSTWRRMPLTSVPWHSRLTDTSCPSDVPFNTLMNVLTYPEVTCKFRCVVRVVAALPWHVSDFKSPTDVYRIRLTLEDATARIHAFLYNEDAEEFFSRLPSPNILSRAWDSLLGVPNCTEGGDASRHPLWIDCCLKSYYTDANDVWGSRRYRIFDTTLYPAPMHPWWYQDSTV